VTTLHGGGLRIALVAACPFTASRGTPIRIHRMAEALAHRGHEVHVVTYHLGEPPVDPPFEVHRIKPLRFYKKISPGPSYRKLLQVDRHLARLLASVLSSNEIDLIHAHHYEGLIVALRSRRRGVPIIYDAHTTLHSELPYYRMGLPRWLKLGVGAVLDRYLPRTAHHTIAVTEKIREKLLDIEAVKPDRVSVISNGVEPELFVERTDRSPERTAKQNTILFAGNLAAYQGIDLLLEAFAELRAQRSDTRLVIASLSSFEECEFLADSLGVRDAVDFIPTGLPQLPAVLARADVAVSPRVDCTGIPQKLLNYMAAGLPVVAFEGSAATIRHGETGLRVPNGDTQALARAIELAIDDRELATRLGQAAQQEMRAERTWAVCAQAVETVYERLLAPIDRRSR